MASDAMNPSTLSHSSKTILKIFGIALHAMSPEETLARVQVFFTEPSFHRIATVNPEFLVLARRDPQFRKALQKAELCVVDGVGIMFVSFLKGKKLQRLPGADLLTYILKQAEEGGYTVYLALRKDGLSTYKEVKQALLEKYPCLILVTNLSQASLVLCSYGAPEQEIYLESLRVPYSNIRLAIGVGGSLDYLTGKQKRAPRWLRALGLEWLWRLIHQPKRWKRIWNAVIVFPFLVLFHKIFRRK